MPAVVSAAEPLPAGEVSEQAALELAHSGLVAGLMSRWPGSICDLDPNLVKDSIEQLLHAVWAALLTADPRPISQTVWWVSALLEFRAQSPTLLDNLHTELTRALHDYPLATKLLNTSEATLGRAARWRRSVGFG